MCSETAAAAKRQCAVAKRNSGHMIEMTGKAAVFRWWWGKAVQSGGFPLETEKQGIWWGKAVQSGGFPLAAEMTGRAWR
ncbi:MAG: hypothetical protein HFI35_06050 [Roseburia sp.]|nr:hypothetical protein [Roseburia sp.]